MSDERITKEEASNPGVYSTTEPPIGCEAKPKEGNCSVCGKPDSPHRFVNQFACGNCLDALWREMDTWELYRRPKEGE